jgi:hypothetical protein
MVDYTKLTEKLPINMQAKLSAANSVVAWGWVTATTGAPNQRM